MQSKGSSAAGVLDAFFGTDESLDELKKDPLKIPAKFDDKFQAMHLAV